METKTINSNHIDIDKRNENVFNLLEKSKAGTLFFGSSVPYTRKNEIIESVLIGIPTMPMLGVMSIENGQAVVTILKNDKWPTAVKSFVDGDFALSGLRILNDLNGKKFDEIHPALQHSIFDTRFDMILVRDVYKDKDAVDYAVTNLTCEG